MTASIPDKPDIVSFWHGAGLGRVHRICLASQVKLGHRVAVYSYAPLDRLPDGVVNADAEPILPMAFADKIQVDNSGGDITHRTAVQLSDFFRIRLQRLGLGVWLDPDVFLLRSCQVDPARPYFAWESHGRLGNSVLYLPRMHPIVEAYERLMRQDTLTVDWLPLHRRAREWIWSAIGRRYLPSELKLAMYGPPALTAFARRHGGIEHARPKKTFYELHARHDLFFEASDFSRYLDDPGVIGFHISPKFRVDEAPLAGSLYAWMDAQVAGRV